jgi:hypothetical protein
LQQLVVKARGGAAEFRAGLEAPVPRSTVSNYAISKVFMQQLQHRLLAARRARHIFDCDLTSRSCLAERKHRQKYHTSDYGDKMKGVREITGTSKKEKHASSPYIVLRERQ